MHLIFSIAVSLFDPESKVTMRALFIAEGSGIPVLTELIDKNRDFQALIRVRQPDLFSAIDKWLIAPVRSCIKPTWKNLILVFRLLDLDRLAIQFEDHLSDHPQTYLEEEGEIHNIVISVHVWIVIIPICLLPKGDIEAVRGEVLTLCDQLSDRDEAIYQLKQKIGALAAHSGNMVHTIKILREKIKHVRDQPLVKAEIKEEVNIKEEPSSPQLTEPGVSSQQSFSCMCIELYQYIMYLLSIIASTWMYMWWWYYVEDGEWNRIIAEDGKFNML